MENSFAEVGLAIAGIKLDSFLTPDLAVIHYYFITCRMTACCATMGRCTRTLKQNLKNHLQLGISACIYMGIGIMM